MKNYLFLVLLSIIWGSYYIANKIATSYQDVLVVGFYVRLFALAVMLIFTRKKELSSIKKAPFSLILIGIVGFLLDFFAFLGLKYSTASNGVLLLRTDVFFTNLISIFLGIKFLIFDWLGTLMMFIGIAFAFNIKSFSVNVGDLFFILSAFFVSLNAFLIKNVKEKYNLSNLSIGFYNNLFALVSFSALTIYSGSSLKIVNIESFLSLFIAGVFQVLIYIVYYKSMELFQIWIIRTFLLSMPIYVIIVSMFLFQEKLNITQIFGVAAILIGVFFIIFSQKRKEANL
jgi:drug/metabolite transporter (DMT)-like permease